MNQGSGLGFRPEDSKFRVSASRASMGTFRLLGFRVSGTLRV